MLKAVHVNMKTHKDAKFPPKALEGTFGSDFGPVHHALTILAQPGTKQGRSKGDRICIHFWYEVRRSWALGHDGTCNKIRYIKYLSL